MMSTVFHLVDELEKLEYVVKEVISYNEACFVEPLMIQVDNYKKRRQRCYKLMTAKGDKRKLDKLKIKLENVLKQIHKSKRENDSSVMECLKQFQISVEKMTLDYPKEEWIDKWHSNVFFFVCVFL